MQEYKADGWGRMGVVMNGKGYGMPSSHAQFAFYFAGSLALFLLLRHRPTSPSQSPSSRSQSYTPSAALAFPHRLALSLLGLVVASLIAGSRVYLNYHTPRQVVAGALAGLAFAGVWFAVTAVVRWSGWLDWMLDTGVARVLRVRDLVVEEDLVQAGWEKWSEKRRRMGAEKGNGYGRVGNDSNDRLRDGKKKR